MATIATLSKTGPDVGGSPGWNPELLPHQSTFRGRGSHQRQHQNPSQKGSRLQKSRLPTAQGAAHGGHKNRIHRASESGLKCRPRRILVQSQKIMHDGRSAAESLRYNWHESVIVLLDRP